MGVEDGPSQKVTAEPTVSSEETPSYPKGKILLETYSSAVLNIYEENWVVEKLDDGGRPTGLGGEGKGGGFTWASQVEPVFARNCYTRLFRASIESLKLKCDAVEV